jgi:hypothetical protein
MRVKISAVAAAMFATIILPASALASCKNGICVSGQDVGNYHVVQLSTTLRGITHYNWAGTTADRTLQQREIGRNETQFSIPLPSTRPTAIRFSVQACIRGGTFSRSSCTPWANFTHTAR